MKTIILLIAIALSLLGCTLPGEQDSVDLRNAEWIGDAKQQPILDSLMYEDDPAPLFRKEFVVDEIIKSAILYITAAGYYSTSVNGKILDKNYCDPAWTNFRKRVYYSEYDIKDNLLHGKNCIAVTLGNGFYNPLPLKFWGKYNLRDALATGRPILIARIRVEYASGRTEEIVTNKTWKFFVINNQRRNI